MESMQTLFFLERKHKGEGAREISVRLTIGRRAVRHSAYAGKLFFKSCCHCRHCFKGHKWLRMCALREVLKVTATKN